MTAVPATVDISLVSVLDSRPPHHPHPCGENNPWALYYDPWGGQTRASSSQHPKGEGRPLLVDRTTCLDGGPHVKGGNSASFPMSQHSSG